MKQFQKILCAVLAAVLLTGCSSVPAESGGAAADAVLAPAAGGIAFTDALDHEVTLESWERVVSLYGSFAETWLLAGGTLAGTTEDAVSERGLDLGEAVAVVLQNPKDPLGGGLLAGAVNKDVFQCSAHVEQYGVDHNLTAFPKAPVRSPGAFFSNVGSTGTKMRRSPAPGAPAQTSRKTETPHRRPPSPLG